MPDLVRQSRNAALASPGPGTAERRELKFVFPGPDPRTLRDVLRANARPVAYGDQRVSSVHSLYFDDHRLSSCRESIAGIPRRAKLRLRWYDEPFARETAFLELKRRNGWLIRKQRLALELGLPLEELGVRGLLAGLDRCAEPEQVAWLGLRGLPTLLVDYQREHFIDRESDTRITLDWDVHCTAQTGARAPHRGAEATLAGLVIVEVKTPATSAADVRRLLHPLAPRLARCSKYVHGCSATGLMDEHEVRV